jgi:hypothetical protein
MKRIMIILLAAILLSGCTKKPTLKEIKKKNFGDIHDTQTTDFLEKKNDTFSNTQIINTIDLITYLDNDSGDICAHVLTIDLLNSTLDLSKDDFFRASGETGWLDRIYPLNISAKSLVLPSEPLSSPMIEVSTSVENELYFQDYILIYDYEQSTAEINKASQAITTVPLSLDGVRYIPQAFFYDDEGKLAVICTTDGYTFDERNPVSLVFALDNDVLHLETINDFRSIFDDYKLSKINMPTYARLETNIYGNAQSKSFMWNEGANAVELNPYDGTVKIILTVDRIENDMPSLDIYRDFYGFFSGFNYQNGVYIAKFPNSNNLEGTIAVFYSNTGEFLGSVICEENNISFLNKDNTEINHIHNTKLKPLLFIPQGSL